MPAIRVTRTQARPDTDTRHYKYKLVAVPAIATGLREYSVIVTRNTSSAQHASWKLKVIKVDITITHITQYTSDFMLHAAHQTL